MVIGIILLVIGCIVQSLVGLYFSWLHFGYDDYVKSNVLISTLPIVGLSYMIATIGFYFTHPHHWNEDEDKSFIRFLEVLIDG